MFEFAFFTAIFYILINRAFKKRRPRTLDAELKALIQQSNETASIGADIRQLLIDVINDDNNDAEKFSDTRINQAQRILDRAGPSAFYWMSEIAAQLAILAAAQINGIPTNVDVELGESATAEDVVRVVVQ